MINAVVRAATPALRFQFHRVGIPFHYLQE
jgi:hypothetical protein